MTIWQRPCLWLNDYRSSSAEMLEPLAASGYRILRIHLNPGMDGWTEPDEAKIWTYRRAGFLVHGVFYLWPDQADAKGWAARADEAVTRMKLQGFCFNGEKELETCDMASGGAYSHELTAEFRRRRPKLPLCLNTYPGLAIAYEHWWQASGRLYLQTHKDPEAIYGPWTNFKEWALRYGWRYPGMVKPQLGCFVNDEGERPPVAQSLEVCRKQGTLGFDVYPADSCMDDVDWLRRLVIEGKAMGVTK